MALQHSDPVAEENVAYYRWIRDLRIGTVLRTIHGNRLRKFDEGWSPLDGAHWDRWTEYCDAEVATFFPRAEIAGS